MPDYPRQGEIWWTEFQEGWDRPAIIVSRNELNKGRLVLVVPCTSSQIDERAKYSNHVVLPSGTAGLTKDTAAQSHLVQPIEASYLKEKIGRLPSEFLGEILLAIAWTIDLFDSSQQK